MGSRDEAVHFPNRSYPDRRACEIEKPPALRERGGCWLIWTTASFTSAGNAIFTLRRKLTRLSRPSVSTNFATISAQAASR
jgi:hypothetical protein